MSSLMKRKRLEVSCYSGLRITSEGLDVLPDFFVEGKLLELHLTSTDEEGRIDICVGSRADYEDLKVIAGFFFKGNPLEIYLAQRKEEGRKLYFALSALITKDLGNCIVFGFYDLPRECSASYSVYDMLVEGRLCGSNCQQGVELFLGELFARCGIIFTGRIGLCQSLMREDYQRQLPIARNTTESMWPSIPAFLLWMIKDKLDIFDDMRLSAVCRDWWLASASYPRKQSLGNGAPCLLQRSEKARCNAQTSKKTRLIAPTVKKTRRNAQTCKMARSNAQDFICVATKKKYTLELPEFQRYFILYSKQGWLLMQQKDSKSAKELGVFLMNPIKKVKIQLPSINPSTYIGFGSFSIREGYPHCVVLLVDKYKDPITIKTAYPGDQVWTNHTYSEIRFQRHGISQLITIREHVYCCNFAREMLIYNMDTQVWKKAPASPWSPEGCTHKYVPEFEGHVVEVRQKENSSEFSFFRYNDAKTSWEELNSDDVKDTSWFVADCFHYSGRFSFGTREKGLKVYHVCSKFNDDESLRGLGPFRRLVEVRRSRADRTGFHVVCYDLMDGSREIISLPYHVSISAIWVDI